MKRLALVLAFAVALAAPSARAAQDVANTRHNLSTSGPGTAGVTKSAAVTEICVFCHTPHNALPDAQLWNHTASTATYTLYTSSTLKTTTVVQPTGKSRLCLACHDGTVGLGNLERPPVGNDLAGVSLTGRANLTSDLSNDHPISFAYNAALLGLNPELADPASTGLPLEGGDQLQCTTCHDPHEADVKPFLRLTTLDGTLCTTCHQRADAWPTSTHATSTAGVAATDLPWRRAEWVAPTVAGNGCLSCHTPHNANFSPERLIAQSPTQFNGVPCLDCHDGTPAADIATDFAGPGNHPVGATSLHDATKLEDPLTMALHVECMDCHNPHTVAPGALPMVSFDPTDVAAPHSTPPLANALIAGVTGIDLNGNPTTSVTNQYELCFKCHGRPGQGPCGTNPTDRCSASATYTRKDGVYNIRDKIHNVPAGGSWHPLITNNSANNGNVPSIDGSALGTGQNSSTTLIYCTDCHNSDRSPVGGGVGPYGPHGSSNPGLLANTYELNVTANGDAATSQLCYNCHDQATMEDSTTSGFTKHGAHLGNRQGSCMKCHDPHGSNINARLINFLTTDGGAEIIGTVNSKGQPVPGSPYWADTGDNPNTGICWLTCHGTGHSGKTY